MEWRLGYIFNVHLSEKESNNFLIIVLLVIIISE